MPVAGVDLPLALIVDRIVQHLAASASRIGGGIVALKNSVWRFAGRCRRILRMSGRKPMSSIRSASSSTRYSMPVELRVRRAHVIEQPARRRDDDVDAAAERVLLRAHADAAEHRRAGDRRVHGEVAAGPRGSARPARASARARARASCRAACRSGGGESAAGTPRSCRCRSAHASTSRPSRAAGIASAWMEVGRTKAHFAHGTKQAGDGARAQQMARLDCMSPAGSICA